MQRGNMGCWHFSHHRPVRVVPGGALEGAQVDALPALWVVVVQREEDVLAVGILVVEVGDGNGPPLLA